MASRAKRNDGASSLVKDEPEVVLPELPATLEPELQSILAKYDQPEDSDDLHRRPKPRLLKKSNQDHNAGIAQRKGTVSQPTLGMETTSRSKGKDNQEMKGVGMDMRLRSASKPRCSPRKHGA
jgi:hypothetical protein